MYTIENKVTAHLNKEKKIDIGTFTRLTEIYLSEDLQP